MYHLGIDFYAFGNNINLLVTKMYSSCAKESFLKGYRPSNSFSKMCSSMVMDIFKRGGEPQGVFKKILILLC